jgi:hypothetical protein
VWGCSINVIKISMENTSVSIKLYKHVDGANLESYLTDLTESERLLVQNDWITDCMINNW